MSGDDAGDLMVNVNSTMHSLLKSLEEKQGCLYSVDCHETPWDHDTSESKKAVSVAKPERKFRIRSEESSEFILHGAGWVSVPREGSRPAEDGTVVYTLNIQGTLTPIGYKMYLKLT